ncbi:MAG: PCRF domain-containing protein, partial [Alphaproteobacteria bacterium]
MNLDEKLDRLIARRNELTELMSSASAADPQEFVRMSKEYAELSPVVECIEELRAVGREIDDLDAMIADAGDDDEMRSLAQEERTGAAARLPEIEHRLNVLLLPKDAADEKNAILEVRAGTGGDEAALFAADLFRMYQRYADISGWKFEVMNISDTGIGGFKEACAEITGK